MVKNLPAMWETQVQSLGQEDPLEKEMVIHSSVLTWRIPWTEEPGRLQFMGRQRVDTTERLTRTCIFYCINMWPCEVADSLLCDPMDCNLPVSAVYGILQARVPDWVAISFSRGSSWPRDQTWVSHIAKQTLYHLSHQGSPFTALILLNSSLRHNQCCYLVIFKETEIKYDWHILTCVCFLNTCAKTNWLTHLLPYLTLHMKVHSRLKLSEY